MSKKKEVEGKEGAGQDLERGWWGWWGGREGGGEGVSEGGREGEREKGRERKLHQATHHLKKVTAVQLSTTNTPPSLAGLHHL